ncbi:flagellar hook-associated protein FlgK [Tardiphaga alba]|uniref:Flagellar hook-associated protein 1 n=1 Tax=Tardiphaga alba TaxID=340268 RepID=A0ABX8AF30_9BRAD|nr:flagellar hook-associated protein FlgK [Tardiphaga alba]QUS40990.1 flagellar hook-associated protein FlgK [Tardiphaga alba]
MSLNTALSIAMAGLRANQAGLALVSSNVANAETPGYIRKATDQIAVTAGDGSSVRTIGVNRELDQYIMAQLRTEMSGAGYATLKSNYLQQMQSLYGNPGSIGSLEYSFNALTSAVQALATSADSSSARIGVLNAAKTLAQQLNSMTQGIQNLRGGAENGIKDSVTTANNLMKQIATINNQLTANPLGGTSTDSSTAALLDRRDQYINQLSQLMDIRVTTNGANQVTVFTGSGVQLVGNEAATLRFDAQNTVSAQTAWNSDPAKSTLGSVVIDLPNGGSIDLTASGAIKSGTIAAYTELRDKTLVEAQNQLDQFAASISSALSDKTTVSPAPVAPATDYALDASKMLPGNVINLTYTDAATGKQQQISLMRVDSPDVLPLPDTATANPNDKVIGIDFSQGVAGILNQINGALGGSVTFSGTSLSSLSVSSNPAFATINGLSTTVTQPPGTLADGSTEFALFTDNGSAYSGGVSTTGSQITGLAGRISVNNGLIADPAKLVTYSSSTLAGDTKRSSYMLNQLNNASFTYGAQTGTGSTSAPFTGNLLSYMRQFVSQQGSAAESAKQLADGQNVVLNTLDKKMADASGVNMDDEMAHLLALQNAYSANARVMSTVNELYKSLMNAF